MNADQHERIGVKIVDVMQQMRRFARVVVAAALLCGVAATTIFPQHFPPPEPSWARSMELTIEVLSPAGTVSKDYLRALEASVKRNWFAVMPVSALLGKKGIVTLVFQIQQDGKIFAGDPKFHSVSGYEAFDKAAADSIRNAAPFEHLPSSLRSQNIKLKVVFYYNLPGDLHKRESHPSESQTVT